MATEGTFTELRIKKAAELREILRLIEDEDGLKNLKEEEIKTQARLAEIQRQIATYHRILDIGQPKPPPTPPKVPVAAEAEGKPRKSRVDREDLKARIVSALSSAGPQGLSVKELAQKIDYGYQSFNTFRKTPEMQKMLESVKDGTAIYLTLRPGAAGSKDDAGGKRGKK